jgi:hypothetical protein
MINRLVTCIARVEFQDKGNLDYHHLSSSSRPVLLIHLSLALSGFPEIQRDRIGQKKSPFRGFICIPNNFSIYFYYNYSSY